MKFQNPSIHHSKVNRRTHRQTDRQTDKLKAICPSNFFKVGGIKTDVTKIHVSSALLCSLFNKIVSISDLYVVNSLLRNCMSCAMRKPDLCICKNKAANELCSYCTADWRLCFHYTDSTISLLLKSKISSSWLYRPVCVTPGLKSQSPIFSRRGSFMKHNNLMTYLAMTTSGRISSNFF